MFSRILGILTFRRATYLEIAKDKNAIGQAAILAVIASLLNGFIGAAAIDGNWASAWQGNIAHVIGRGAVFSFSLFASWIIIAVLFVLVAGLFKGKSTMGEMLRVTGFIQVFSIPAFLCAFALAILGAVSAIQLVVFIFGVLELGGYTIAVSEAAGITMRKALITALIVEFVGFFAVVLFADLIMAVLKIPVT
jgi:hypothetical protein